MKFVTESQVTYLQEFGSSFDRGSFINMQYVLVLSISSPNIKIYAIFDSTFSNSNEILHIYNRLSEHVFHDIHETSSNFWNGRVKNFLQKIVTRKDLLNWNDVCEDVSRYLKDLKYTENNIHYRFMLDVIFFF